MHVLLFGNWGKHLVALNSQFAPEYEKPTVWKVRHNPSLCLCTQTNTLTAVHSTNRSAHSITAQYQVPSDGWRKASSFRCVVALAISGAALQLDGNQTDSFTLKGGLDKATTWANWQQGGCEMLWLIQLTVQIGLSLTQQLAVWLRIVYYCKCAEHDDKGHALTQFTCVLVTLPPTPPNNTSPKQNSVGLC